MTIFSDFSEYAILMILLCICAVFSSLQLYKRAFRYVGIKMIISVLVTLYISGLFFYFLYISRKNSKDQEDDANTYNARLFFDKYIGVFMIFFLLFYGVESYRKITKALDPNEVIA
tara:strand:- start:331 stop:678 length:348 start_codon:yes stop_codon:yes gene_type:complete